MHHIIPGDGAGAVHARGGNEALVEELRMRSCAEYEGGAEFDGPAEDFAQLLLAAATQAGLSIAHSITGELVYARVTGSAEGRTMPPARSSDGAVVRRLPTAAGAVRRAEDCADWVARYIGSRAGSGTADGYGRWTRATPGAPSP